MTGGIVRISLSALQAVLNAPTQSKIHRESSQYLKQALRVTRTWRSSTEAGVRLVKATACNLMGTCPSSIPPCRLQLGRISPVVAITHALGLVQMHRRRTRREALTSPA